jgi:hypothetical protein
MRPMPTRAILLKCTDVMGKSGQKFDRKPIDRGGAVVEGAVSLARPRPKPLVT